MSNPHEWKSWSSLPLAQREQLPNQSGIYIVVDTEEQVWYVGKSKNLNARWNGGSHHRYKQLSRTNNKRYYKIYWKFFPSDQLNEKEQLYISLFKPHLNYSAVRAYARKSVQPNGELSRLLKVLNHKTMLFPNLRSVVLGYYTEIDEEEGELKEYTCIVIAVSVNDHDRVILKSAEKSLSRKGNSLKDCWYIYENECGIDDPEIRAAFIPVFVLGDLVYEFLPCPDLIERLALAQNSSNLHTIEIEKQPVVALKDVAILGESDILPPLPTTGRRFGVAGADYLRYRASDLLPVMKLMRLVSGG